jgi:hypothetical protein
MIILDQLDVERSLRIVMLALLVLWVCSRAAHAVEHPLPDEVPLVAGPWVHIATEDYDAGAYNNKPAAGEAVKEAHQEVSDFTVYRAADGTWQLVSAVRQTKFPGEGHLFFRWEGKSLTEGPWEEKGILWTTSTTPNAKYMEGVIYAPHCVKEGSRYYMFHNSSGTVQALISDDGKRFEQARDYRGEYVFFDAGEAGRDLMILDHRKQDGLWYCYYTGMDRERRELNDRQHHDVYVRTAKTLTGPWSERHAVGLGTPNRPRDIVHARYDFVNAESQFVIHRDGFYFKFEQTYVVASDDPFDFEGKPIVASLYPNFNYPEDWWPALAPEVIVDGDEYYVAMFRNHKRNPLKEGGVFVAPLNWAPRDK